MVRLSPAESESRCTTSGVWLMNPKSLTRVSVMSSATWLPRLVRRQVIVEAESGLSIGVALALETESMEAEAVRRL